MAVDEGVFPQILPPTAENCHYFPIFHDNRMEDYYNGNPVALAP